MTSSFFVVHFHSLFLFSRTKTKGAPFMTSSFFVVHLHFPFLFPRTKTKGAPFMTSSFFVVHFHFPFLFPRTKTKGALTLAAGCCPGHPQLVALHLPANLPAAGNNE